MREQANYVTCPFGHKLCVIWSPMKQVFAFTCDTCECHFEYAATEQGRVKIIVFEPVV
jgi:predicted  nucleic acid-binding Zn ribbon protein